MWKIFRMHMKLKQQQNQNNNNNNITVENKTKTKKKLPLQINSEMFFLLYFYLFVDNIIIWALDAFTSMRLLVLLY